MFEIGAIVIHKNPLHREPSHGYGIIQEIDNESGDVYINWISTQLGGSNYTDWVDPEYLLPFMDNSLKNKFYIGSKVKIKRTGRHGTIENLIGKNTLSIRTGRKTIRTFSKEDVKIETN